jgi:hypothetical protein
MTNPTPSDLPEPRDIALEVATPEQVAALEEASTPEEEPSPGPG